MNLNEYTILLSCCTMVVRALSQPWYNMMVVLTIIYMFVVLFTVIFFLTD